MAGSTIDTPRPAIPPGDPTKTVWARPIPEILEEQRRERLKDWPEPADLSPLAAPAYQPGLLPEWLDQWAYQVSTATQTPIDLAVLLGLAVCSLAVSRRYSIMAREWWTESLNLYVVSVLPSASRKSAVFGKATKVLYEYERRRAHDMATEIAESKAELRFLQQQLKAVDNSIPKAKSSIDREIAQAEYRDLTKRIDAFEEVHAPRLLADDITQEELSVLMAQNDGRMGVFSSEGDFFDILAGRYTGGKSNLGLFLKGHDAGPYNADRISRARVSIERPVLTLGLTIQPGVLQDLAAQPGFLDRGVIGRIVFAVPQSNIGYRNSMPDPVDDSVKQSYADHVNHLLKIGEKDGDVVLQLSPEAYEAHIMHEEAVEKALLPGGEYHSIIGWAGKLVGLTARLAGIFHLADMHTAQDQISRDTMDRAIALAEHYARHALKAFGAMQADSARSEARAVIEWLQAHAVKPDYQRREIHRGLQSKFPRIADLDRALGYLVETDWIRMAEKPIGRGGRRVVACEISPYVWEP